jgi:hypothetical protein
LGFDRVLAWVLRERSWGRSAAFCGETGVFVQLRRTSPADFDALWAIKKTRGRRFVGALGFTGYERIKQGRA